jgi:hypothetical protein
MNNPSNLEIIRGKIKPQRVEAKDITRSECFLLIHQFLYKYRIFIKYYPEFKTISDLINCKIGDNIQRETSNEIIEFDEFEDIILGLDTKVIFLDWFKQLTEGYLINGEPEYSIQPALILTADCQLVYWNAKYKRIQIDKHIILERAIFSKFSFLDSNTSDVLEPENIVSILLSLLHTFQSIETFGKRIRSISSEACNELNGFISRIT